MGEVASMAEYRKKHSIDTVLDEKIPRDVISKRDGGGGRQLDYLETWYVIDRLNKVFGNLGWTQETVFIGEITGLDIQKPTYMAKVRITVFREDDKGNVTGSSVTHEGVGYGNDKGAQNPHELGMKEAESDALKRAAMKFGLSMGLALYDRSQENVDEGTEVKPKAGAGNTKRVAVKEPAGSKDAAKPADARAPIVVNPESSAGGAAKAVSSTAKTRDDVNGLINSTSRVAISKKLYTKDSLLGYMQEKYQTQDKTTLTDVQAGEFLKYLETVINGGSK